MASTEWKPPNGRKLSQHSAKVPLPHVAETLQDVVKYLQASAAIEVSQPREIAALPHLLVVSTPNPVLVIYKRLDGEGGIPGYEIGRTRNGQTEIKILSLGVGVPLPNKYRFLVVGGKETSLGDTWIDEPNEVPEPPATYADTAITSDPLASTDGFITITGPTARDQFLQILDSSVVRERHNELLRVVESLNYTTQGDTSAVLAIARAGTIILHGQYASSLAANWIAYGGASSGFLDGTVYRPSNLGYLGAEGGWSSLAGPGAGGTRAGAYNRFLTIANQHMGTWAFGIASGVIRYAQTNLGTWSTGTTGSGYTGTWIRCLDTAHDGFAIFGTGGEIQTSPDGITWTRRYNTGGDFIDAESNDSQGVIVGIRAASYVHNANNGLSGTFTDASLPITGVYGIAYHRTHGFLVAGTGGTAWSPDGLNWVQVETSEVIDTGTHGGFAGLHAVAGGFILVAHRGHFYYTSRPTEIGSWDVHSPPALNLPSNGTCLMGVHPAKQHVVLVAHDPSVSSALEMVFVRESTFGRYA